MFCSEHNHTSTDIFHLHLTHLSLGTQVLLSVDLECQPLGHLQFLDVSSRSGSKAWHPSSDGCCRGSSSCGTSGRPGSRQILHPLFGVKHALNLLLNLGKEDDEDVLER